MNKSAKTRFGKRGWAGINSDVCVHFTIFFQKPRALDHNFHGVLSGRLLFQPVDHSLTE
jgi:hypothetical protein